MERQEISLTDNEIILIRELLHKEIKSLTAYVSQAHKTCSKLENQLRRRRKLWLDDMEISGVSSEEIERCLKEHSDLHLKSMRGDYDWSIPSLAALHERHEEEATKKFLIED
jgi:hypothetical protein